MRISRPCYDKYHRCPGWAGGGTKGAKVDRCPRTGYVDIYYHALGNGNWTEFDKPKTLWKWRIHRCIKCGVYVLPHHIRWLDWRWWKWEMYDFWRFRDWFRRN
jgi:hypothetical protein